MSEVKWFLILMGCLNCIGIDPGIQFDWSANMVERARIQVADQVDCERLKGLNPGSECWVKVEEVKQK